MDQFVGKVICLDVCIGAYGSPHPHSNSNEPSTSNSNRAVNLDPNHKSNQGPEGVAYLRNVIAVGGSLDASGRVSSFDLCISGP